MSNLIYSGMMANLIHSGVFNMHEYDYTTLYANLDMQVVESLLYELFDLLYSNTYKFICVSNYKNNCFSPKKNITASQLVNLKTPLNM